MGHGRAVNSMVKKIVKMREGAWLRSETWVGRPNLWNRNGYAGKGGMVVPSSTSRLYQISAWAFFDGLFSEAFCGSLGICLG